MSKNSHLKVIVLIIVALLAIGIYLFILEKKNSLLYKKYFPESIGDFHIISKIRMEKEVIINISKESFISEYSAFAIYGIDKDKPAIKVHADKINESYQAYRTKTKETAYRNIFGPYNFSSKTYNGYDYLIYRKTTNDKLNYLARAFVFLDDKNTIITFEFIDDKKRYPELRLPDEEKIGVLVREYIDLINAYD